MSCEPKAPSATGLRLLTRVEYDNTLRDLLGDETQPARNFPREPLAGGFDNDAASNNVSGDALMRYLLAAEGVAARAMQQQRGRLLGCSASDPTCASTFIRDVGRRLYRRPLDVDEQEALMRVVTIGSEAGGFDAGIEWALQAMLQSPAFLYRDERRPSVMQQTRLDGYRLATRLAYTVWASTPDDALLDAAAAGALDAPEGVDAQLPRLLADPRATDAKARFLSLWLGIEGTETVNKDTGTYPDWTLAMSESWRRSLELFLADVSARGGSLPTLLLNDSMYIDSHMAMYADAAPSDGFMRVGGLPERVGLLTQPGFLARLSAQNQSSPIRRGVFVLDKLLCQPPSSPPPEANLEPPPPSDATTTRERFAAHTQGDCATCHTRIDGAGFLFEHYDGMGQWRDSEGGKPVDASGALFSTRQRLLDGELTGVRALSERLAASGQVADCFAREWVRFSLGRELDEADSCSVYQVQRDFAASGGSFDALLTSLVRQDAFVSHGPDPLTLSEGAR